MSGVIELQDDMDEGTTIDRPIERRDVEERELSGQPSSKSDEYDPEMFLADDEERCHKWGALSDAI